MEEEAKTNRHERRSDLKQTAGIFGSGIYSLCFNQQHMTSSKRFERLKNLLPKDRTPFLRLGALNLRLPWRFIQNWEKNFIYPPPPTSLRKVARPPKRILMVSKTMSMSLC